MAVPWTLPGAGTGPDTVSDPVMPPYHVLFQWLNVHGGRGAQGTPGTPQTRSGEDPQWGVMQNAVADDEER